MTKCFQKRIAMGAAVVGMLSLSGTTVLADVVVDAKAILESGVNESIESTLDFGTVALAPDTTMILLDASGASNTSATPVTAVDATSTGIATGASAGVVKINSSLKFGYKATYTSGTIAMAGEANGGEIYLSDIGGNSTDFTSAYMHDGSAPTTANSYIHIGGKLDIPANTPLDTYNGSIDVTIAYEAYVAP